MSKQLFPNDQKVYIQNNRSNVYPQGNLWSTMGTDFQSNVGVLRVAPRLKINSQTSDLANLGLPVAFKYFSGTFWTVAGARVFFGGNSPEDAYTQDTHTNTPTTCSSDTADLEVFDGRLWVTTQTGLLSNGGGGTVGDWTDRGMTLTTGLVHITRYFPQFNRLYVTNGTFVYSIDTTNSVVTTGDYTISLPFGNLITSMEVTSDTIWIGTQSRDVANMNGNVFQWDGISAQADNVYPLQAKGVRAIVINQNTDNPSVMDDLGILREFNGQGFAEIGRLPYTNVYPLDSDGLNASGRFIHFNGLAYTPNNTILANINNLDNLGGISENIPSGVWEWSKETNFVHKYPFTYNIVGNTSTITDWGQNKVSAVGAIENAIVPVSDESDQNGNILVGATFYTDASTTTKGIFINDTINTTQKKGYVVTDWWESKEVASSWNFWWMSYRKFLNASDNITIKYRYTEETPTYIDITWVNTTSFTTATNPNDYWTSNTGGEVEILQGVGSGLCAHITNITGPSGGLYTVTIDETATGATTTTAKARLQKWIKAFPKDPVTTPANWAVFALGGDSQPRIQVKICYTFTGNGEHYKSILTSNEDIKSE